METVNKLEATVATWYKTMPHLPQEGRKWLATNVWWLTLIGVILGVSSVLGLVAITFSVGALLGIYGGVAGAAIGGLIFIASIVSIALMVLIIVLAAMAIMPLKMMQKKGWTLLFVIALVQVVGLVVSFLFNFNVIGLVWGLIVPVASGYFLFEIHDFYGKSTVNKTNTR